MIHTVKGFGIINRAEVDVFLELSCFFNDPVDVDSLLSGSSAFSESNLYIWKFSRNILLKPSLKDFEHYLLACEISAIVQYWYSLQLRGESCYWGVVVGHDLHEASAPASTTS